MRLLPKVLQQSKFFSFSDSKFFSEKQDMFSKKEFAARRVCHKELGIPICYTLETSFHGFKPSNGKSVISFTEAHY
jgi:hypothetical protein